MIEYVFGNIFDSDAEALVNPVNCVGVMGAGLALQFKQRFPGNYRYYKRECKEGRIALGQVLVVPISMTNPKYIINLPTKKHWKDKSHLWVIGNGLAALRREINELDIKSVAIPALGCGLGGLGWEVVKDKIGRVLGHWNVRVMVYRWQE